MYCTYTLDPRTPSIPGIPGSSWDVPYVLHMHPGYLTTEHPGNSGLQQPGSKVHLNALLTARGRGGKSVLAAMQELVAAGLGLQRAGEEHLLY